MKNGSINNTFEHAFYYFLMIANLFVYFTYWFNIVLDYIVILYLLKYRCEYSYKVSNTVFDIYPPYIVFIMLNFYFTTHL